MPPFRSFAGNVDPCLRTDLEDIMKVTIDEIKSLKVWSFLFDIKKQNILSGDNLIVIIGFILSKEEGKDLFYKVSKPCDQLQLSHFA